MSDGREERLAADFEAVADWFRHEQPEIGEPDLDRIKRRAMVQARRRPSETRLPAWLAGGLSATKGALMGMRPRPFMTLFLALGLIGVVSLSTLFASGQLPGLGGFDAAQTQYEDDDDDGNPGGGNGRGNNNAGGNGRGRGRGRGNNQGPPPGQIRTCDRAPFRTERGFAACNREAVLVASGFRTPAQACGRFPVTLGRQAACLAAAGPPPGTLP